MLRPGTSPQFIKLFTLFFLFTFTKSDDLQILLKLKDSFSKSNPNLFESWNSDSSSPCTFTGVTCNKADQISVTQINLPHKKLTGKLPLDSICQIPSLERLDFAANSLFGSVSEDLKNCTSLKFLDLSNNSLSGSFPEFDSLEKLEFLNLNLSGISGKFPWSSLTKLTNLTFLSVGDTHLDPSPFPMEILNLKKLDWLYLTNCSIQGEIPPGIGDLKELKNLELSTNNLTGEIPVEIGNLKKLEQLELFENGLTGKLPVTLRNLTALKNLDASNNLLEGDISEVKFLSNLITLQLFKNKFSGEIPAEIGDFKYLVNLSLYGNKLSGPLPERLGSWADFDFIDVSENELSGEIPPEMCKNGHMTEILILQNKFTGGIPKSYGSCLSLTRIRVSDNLLSGTIPEAIWGLPKLNFLDLSTNKFEGSIASDIGNAKSLEQMYIDNNRFSGELPPEISNASSLGLIDLSVNEFTGSIPPSISELKNLHNLYLQENTFTGAIPSSIALCSSLNVINLAGNFLTGEIPASLGSLPSLNSLNLSRNRLSGPIPPSLSSLTFSQFDLSNNRLTGEVPQPLSNEAYNGSFVGNSGLCSSDIKYLRNCSSGSGNSRHIRTFISCFIAGAMIIIISVGLYMFVRKWRSLPDDKERNLSFTSSDSWNLKSFSVLTFTEQEVVNAIKQENLIGTGGSGNVYRVFLANGIELAVKHIWKSESGDRKSQTTAMLMKKSGNLPEFDAEVTTLSSIRHVNVVKLYCSITSEDSSLLVYEYLPNGSLWDRLHTCRKIELDWETRYEIAVGAGKGLEYLHHGLDRPVIHRDVKSSNILLDEFCKPRIADFGLAKIVQGGGSKDSTHVIAGTHGYIAPEYAYTYKVSEKSDVYSFGVVLMELVTGKRPIEPEFGDNKDIVYWICSRMTSRESIMDVVDSNIPESFKDDAVKVLRIAVLCTARLPALRPSMRTVVQMLEDAEPCKLVSISVVKDKLSRSCHKKDGLILELDDDSNKLKMSP